MEIYIQTIIIVMTGFLCACGGKEPEDFSLSGAREGREELRQWAVLDEGRQVYRWERMGGGNYAPQFLQYFCSRCDTD